MPRKTPAALADQATLLSPRAVAALKQSEGVACSHDTILKAIQDGFLPAYRVMSAAFIETDGAYDRPSALGVTVEDARKWDAHLIMHRLRVE